MRNEKLTGYSLHHRYYRDKRSLYYLFTQEMGVVHGIGKRGIPQFIPLILFATGKKSLKTFSQINATQGVELLMGQQQYAALYLNEITLKLIPVEEPYPTLYECYAMTVDALRQPLENDELRLVLRHYEQTLFTELGFGIDLYQDSAQHEIEATKTYFFLADSGWVVSPNSQLNQDSVNDEFIDSSLESLQESESMLISTTSPALCIQGSDIIAMQTGISKQNLANYSLIHRQVVDHLFEYKLLQSRLLWQQFNHYQ